MTELLEAVDALTKPKVEKFEQRTYETAIGPDGRPELDESGEPIRNATGTQSVRVVTDPLLVRLQEAVTSTISRRGGGGADKHARNILDSGALYEFMRITATITDWCAIVKIRPTRDATRDLRRWYAARLATNPDSDEFYIEQLRRWETTILSKLNAPRSWEVKDACPVCHYTTWVDEAEVDGKVETIERNRPILVEYWPDSRDVLESARAHCRRCGMQWRGSGALRALRFDLDTREQSSESGITTV